MRGRIVMNRSRLASIALLATIAPAAIASADSTFAANDTLSRLSLADLANLEVTSAAKVPETLRSAAASMYVITHEQIARSGVTSIAQALRLAPNLLLTQLDSRSWSASARGFGGNVEAQNFSNKLLMLIDGRSVYTPLFSGIYFDAQDVILDDVDRIEVISGPGGTLWGANAMNGVINVITRSAAQSQGALLQASAGNEQQQLGARWGMPVGESSALRVYGKAMRDDAQTLADGGTANDGMQRGQGGFRFDWTGGAQNLTLQGDGYSASAPGAGALHQHVQGANALLRWQRHAERSDFQAQVYADLTERRDPYSIAFVLHTYDLELQHSFWWTDRHQFVIGAGERIHDYGITNSIPLAFNPANRTLHMTNVFAQDSINLGKSWRAVAGVKWEKDPLSPWIALPNLRLLWEPRPGRLLWAAASQANRSATPFDVDVVERFGSLVYLTGNQHFRPERLTAFETGIRDDLGSSMSLSLTFFYNRYRDLRSVEPSSSSQLLPFVWGNLLKGDTYGVDAWADWQVSKGWRLSPGLGWTRQRLKSAQGASGLLPVSQAGNDPSIHATLNSSMDLSDRVNFDASLRYVGARPDPALRAFVELSARLAWHVSPQVEIAASGDNLLHPGHVEYPSPSGLRIERSGSLSFTYRY